MPDLISIHINDPAAILIGIRKFLVILDSILFELLNPLEILSSNKNKNSLMIKLIFVLDPRPLFISLFHHS